MNLIGMNQAGKGNGTRFLKQVCKDYEFNTVLDVGAGNGGDSEMMQGLGKEVVPIDVSERTLARMRQRGLSPIKASATDLPFRNESFDMIVAIDFMEHLRERDVDACLNEFHRVTKRYVALQIGTAKAKGPWPKDAGYNLENIHLSIWPPKKWNRRFRKRGFTVLEADAKRSLETSSKTKLFYVVLEKSSAAKD